MAARISREKSVGSILGPARIPSLSVFVFLFYLSIFLSFSLSPLSFYITLSYKYASTFGIAYPDKYLLTERTYIVEHWNGLKDKNEIRVGMMSSIRALLRVNIFEDMMVIVK